MKTIRLTESQLHSLIKESIHNILLTEAFKSDTLRDFFQEHGGVDRKYRQFSLGDISEEQIGYSREFNSPNEAIIHQHKLTRSGNRNQRSDYDMKYLFQVYVANDGTALLLGIDRNTIETKPYWSGEQEKKVADRLWRNGWNFKTRDNRYADDSDTYYYQSPAKDFGVHKSGDYKNKMHDNQRELERTPQEQRQELKKKKLQGLKDYLNTYYPKKYNR